MEGLGHAAGAAGDAGEKMADTGGVVPSHLPGWENIANADTQPTLSATPHSADAAAQAGRLRHPGDCQQVGRPP